MQSPKEEFRDESLAASVYSLADVGCQITGIDLEDGSSRIGFRE
jgi:hypothetical protein